MPPPPRAGTNTDSSDSQQSTSNGSEQTADNDADKPGQSSDGWLEGEPTGGNGDQGEWQTSNQGIPDGSGDADASGSADATEAAGDDTKNGADQALAEALEGLDGEILAERAVLRETEAAGKPGNSGSSPGQPSAADTTMGSNGTAASSSPTTATRGRVNTPPPPPKRGDDTAPTNLPDAKDDDIIARQLREAAMQETDPELKEKLWDEYRRYKKG
jgi:hypothetical protein